MKRTLWLLGLASCALFFAAPGTAHIESSAESDVTVERGRWHGKFRLYGSRVDIRREHVHWGRGNQICTGLDRRGAQSLGCGFFPKRKKPISVVWGTACELQPNGFVAGTAQVRVARIVSVFTNGRRIDARRYRAPDRLDFDGKFWLVIHRKELRLKSVRAFGKQGELIRREGGLNKIGTNAECE